MASEKHYHIRRIALRRLIKDQAGQLAGEIPSGVGDYPSAEGAGLDVKSSDVTIKLLQVILETDRALL